MYDLTESQRSELRKARAIAAFWQARSTDLSDFEARKNLELDLRLIVEQLDEVESSLSAQVKAWDSLQREFTDGDPYPASPVRELVR